MQKEFSLTGGCLSKERRPLFLRVSLFFLLFCPLLSFAHPSPNTLVFLDISPGQVAMEVQLPEPELELSFGNNISKDPEHIIELYGPQIKAYLLQHIHAYVSKSRLWQVKIIGLKMDKSAYVDSNIPYWEVNAELLLVPQAEENTRKFFLDYDVIMHQVINHVALVSIRNDWETGKVHRDSAEVAVIGWDLKSNTIPPLEVDLGKGSGWKGFSSMVRLGMEHIREGTDHLLFLLVLLLPAMLVVKGKQWGGNGGIRYSIIRILKIVTAFTIGHSFTLLLATLEWVRLPQQPVEVLIAFSILVSAIHAIYPIFFGREMYVAAGFGLIHGLAFATVLSSLNLGKGTLVLSILGFNAGIELMQLFVVLITVPWLMILSKRKEYKYLRIGGALFAAAAAIAWIVQRSLNKNNVLSLYTESILRNGRWIVFGLALLAISSFFWPKKAILKKVHRPGLRKVS